MGTFTDLTGRRFGRIRVVKLDSRGNGVYWSCLCDCGKSFVIRSAYLTPTKDATKSCGCIHKERMREIKTTHGQTLTYAYRAWGQIVQRCTNPNNPAFIKYGGRGITLHEPWRESFSAFFEGIGERPTEKHTLDRKDNNSGYVPGNVRWATKKEQARNRRSNRLLTVGDEAKTVAEWAESTKTNRTTIEGRMARGWNARKAIFGR